MTHLALKRERLPSKLYLCMYIHLSVTMLAFSGQGTRVHVLLEARVWNSSSIAAFQLGSLRAPYVLGMGETSGRVTV
jgi:hypothetical protein